MKRLVTFGCSYTYGQGLDDCFVPPNDPGPNPSKHAWPSLVAENLNYECYNMAKSGYSNLAILNSILNFTFLPDDLVIVMWTFKNRDMEYKNPNSVIHRGRWLKQWAVQQNVYDLLIKGYLHIHHAYFYLKDKNINFYFLDADYYIKKEETPEWMNEVYFIDFPFAKYEQFPPMGLDNLHPGPVFHKMLAKTIIQSING